MRRTETGHRATGHRLSGVERLRRTASAGVKGFQFPGSGGGSGGLFGLMNNLLPSAEYDYRRGAGLLWENSVILAGLKWEADAFTESPFVVRRRKGQKGSEIVEDHPLSVLMRAPNDDWDETLLFQALRMSFTLDGNAYLYKVRSAAGKWVQSWWVPHWMITPAWDDDGNDFITLYTYRVNGKSYQVPKADIIHFRDGIDPSNTRKGLSRLAASLKEVCTDNERATFAAAVLRNSGVLSLIITPDGEKGQAEFPPGVSPESISELLMAKTTGDRRGEPFVSDLPIKIQKSGLNPAEMILDKIARIPESRMAAAMRIPPVVIGLEVGLEAGSDKHNYDSALAAAYRHNVIPAYRVFGSTMDRKALPEFPVVKGDRCGFDTSDVQALQEDMSDLANRAAILYKAGLARRWEGKEMVGMEYDPHADECYFTDLAGAGASGSLGQAVDLPDGAEKAFYEIAERAKKGAVLSAGEVEVLRGVAETLKAHQEIARMA